MLLLEIGFSEKFDTFTGYVCDNSEYFNYEVNREEVKLTQIEERFNTPQHFIETFSKNNSELHFLTKPIEIKSLKYDELKRYKKLTLPKSGKGFGIISKLLIILVIIGLMAGVYAGYLKYFHPESEASIALPFTTTSEKEIIQYYYEIELIAGGFIVGFDMKQNKENVLVTNRKGLELNIDLSSVRFIEKVELNNEASRQIIYGIKLE